MRVASSIGVGFVSLMLFASCGSPYTRSHQGYDVTLKAIERQGSTIPHGGGRFTATEGHEIVLVRFELAKTGSSAGEVTFEGFELVCADGSTGESPIVKYSGVFPAEPTPLDVPFGIPKGGRPKTLRVGELTFDVEGFPVKPSSGG